MKKLWLFLIMMFACVMVVACGEKEEDGEKTPTPDQPVEPTQGDELTEIKLGSSGPLTGSAALYGIAVKNGIELAIEEINKAGGVTVNGKQVPFKLINFYNDEADGEKAKGFCSQLLDDGVDVIVGAVTTGATEGLVSTATKAGVPVITPSGTGDQLTVGPNGDERPIRTNIFRACFYDSYQGEFMAKYAKEQGMKKPYVLYNSNDAYSIGLKDAFVKTAKELGISAKESGYLATDGNFASAWAAIIDGGYDCVFIPDYYQKVYTILQAGAEAGYQGVCYGGDGWDGVLGEVKEGDNVAFLDKCYYSNHFFAGSENEAVKSFVEAYKAKYNGEEPASFAALAYDAVFMAKQAIEAANSVEYKDVVKALTNGEFSNLVTCNGSFKFKDGNPQKDALVITFKNGVQQEVK